MRTFSLFAPILTLADKISQQEQLNAMANQLSYVKGSQVSSDIDASADELFNTAVGMYSALESGSTEVSKADIAFTLFAGKMLTQTAFFEMQGGNINDVADDDFLSARGKKSKVKGEEKFINYGCFCSPSQIGQPDSNWLGVGNPVDEIDHLCHDLHKSYNCLKVDYGKECSPTTPYNWELQNDVPVCVDEVGTCAGDVCQLDMFFARSLISVASKWSAKYHILNGFDREAECGNPSNQPDLPPVANLDTDSGKSSGSGSSSNKSSDTGPQCCGFGLNRHIFHVGTHQCCQDGTSKLAGEC
ncbi:unnamed protein product [Oikopleura dioica]|uniref:phospholipase A2 n=1 Tax=Oikopleura dioica TaxID=34765 RepID=E4X477_OIKDI|nr:unnamed protein product [Oikopleura dioica]CBY34064.1 unnamed protein product [Oikopleura dioica]